MTVTHLAPAPRWPLILESFSDLSHMLEITLTDGFRLRQLLNIGLKLCNMTHILVKFKYTEYIY